MAGDEDEGNAAVPQQVGKSVGRDRPQLDIQDGKRRRGPILQQCQRRRHGGGWPDDLRALLLQLLAQVLGQDVLVLYHQHAVTPERGRVRPLIEQFGQNHVCSRIRFPAFLGQNGG